MIHIDGVECQRGNVKKVRFNLKRGKKSWSFTIYDSVESAYYLKDEPVMDDEIEEYRRVVTMNKGETIEAEWLGSEWVYGEEEGQDPKSYRKFDKVRLGKISRLKNTPIGTNYLELYSGWVSNAEFSWKPDDNRDDIRITRLSGRNASKVDFSKLFVSQSSHPDDVYEEEEGEFSEEIHNSKRYTN